VRNGLANVSFITRTQGDPVARYREWRAGLGAADGLLLVTFDLAQGWLPGTPHRSLTAIYCVNSGSLRLAVTDRTLAADRATPLSQYRQWQRQHGLAEVVPGEPLPLRPLPVLKPWGRELWFTGVEARGVCCFGSNGAGGGDTPIPWLQAVLPGAVAGHAGEPLVLLKILEPLPEPVKGDLYFELHEQKREVYVVTNVDPVAWPDGTGYIRYGFCPQRLAGCASEAQFRTEFLAVVTAYEAVRRRIDALPQGVEAPQLWRASEARLRQRMEGYTWRRPLRQGDVLSIPLLMPHALQHGVRTIEIQTPVYERMILSFAQKVLTQDHWDTAAAVAKMRLRPPAEKPAQSLRRCDGIDVARIAECPEFEVRRIRLGAGGALPLALDEHYALLIVIAGAVDLGGRRYEAEQAVLLPRGWRGEVASARASGDPVFLLTLPRL
jgi:hypothetical protein